MKRINLIIIFFLLCFTFQVNAQQDAHFSHYMFNGLYYNPGYAGLEGITRFNMIHRAQWLGYEASRVDDINRSGYGAPSSTIISANSPLPFFNKRSGAGIHMLHDVLGPMRNIEIQLSGSYHLKLGDGLLGLGARGGIYSQRLDGSLYNPVDKDDPIYLYLIGNRATQAKPDVAAGAWYSTKKYYAGLSFNHLPQSRFSFGFDQITSRLSNHMYFNAGYNFEYGPMIKITPSIIVHSDLNQLTYAFGALGLYNEMVFGGINFRQSFAQRDVSKGGKTFSNDDIFFIVGMNLLKNQQNMNSLRLSYAFDFVTSGVLAKKRTSHEILVSYIVPTPWEVPKPKVRTPRYRHDEN